MLFAPWLALSTLLIAAATALPAPVTTERQWVMPPTGPYTVGLENMRGRVVVRGWDKNVVYLRMTKEATGPLAEAEAALYRTLTLGAENEGAGVTARADWGPDTRTYPAVLLSRTPHMSVSFELLVPPGTAVRLRQTQGPIVAHGLDGRLTVASEDGLVAVSGCRGRIEVTTARGAQRFENIDGDVVASTQHGALTFAGCRGDLHVRTLDGPVQIGVPPRFAGEISFHTVSGLIRSDLETAHTDMAPDDKGYVGVLRGPLAGSAPPEVRYRIDTLSGTTVIANERPRSR